MEGSGNEGRTYEVLRRQKAANSGLGVYYEPCYSILVCDCFVRLGSPTFRLVHDFFKQARREVVQSPHHTTRLAHELLRRLR